jgi:hypothetical protein
MKSCPESWRGKVGSCSGESDVSTDDYSDDDIVGSSKKSAIPCHGAMLACGGGGSPENDPGLANRYYGEYRHKKYSGKLLRELSSCGDNNGGVDGGVGQRDVPEVWKQDFVGSPCRNGGKLSPTLAEHACQTNSYRAPGQTNAQAASGDVKREQNNNEFSSSRTSSDCLQPAAVCHSDSRRASDAENRRESSDSSASERQSSSPSPSLEDRWSAISVPPKKRWWPRALELHGQVLVTDVTCHRVTVTFLESATEKGFFKEYSQ